MHQNNGDYRVNNNKCLLKATVLLHPSREVHSCGRVSQRKRDSAYCRISVWKIRVFWASIFPSFIEFSQFLRQGSLSTVRGSRPSRSSEHAGPSLHCKKPEGSIRDTLRLSGSFKIYKEPMPELVCDIHLEKLAENIQKYSKIEERKYRENDMHVNDDSHSSDSRPTSDNEVSSSSDRNNDEPSVRRKRKSVENMCHEREHHGDHLQMQVASVIASNLGPMVEIVEKKLLQHKNAEKLLNDGREVFIKTLEEHNQKKGIVIIITFICLCNSYKKVERKAKLVAIPPMKARNRRSSRNSLVYIDGPSTSESHSSMVQQVPIIDNIPEVLENETAVCSISSEADHNSRGIKDNQEFAIEISGEVSRTDDICDDFAVFLKKCTVLLTKFIDSYYDFRSTMKLKPEDAIEHWSAERLTKEEHAARSQDLMWRSLERHVCSITSISSF
nr:hypothetical protein C35D10.7 - Caenorhabditis elegans [Caenorhabditis elegans]